MSKREKEIIKLIKNQTDYDEETIIKKLKEHNGNYIFIIKEYLNPNFKNKKEEEKKLSTNQQMMKGYRDFLDDAYNQYQRRKNIQEQVENYLNKNKDDGKDTNEVIKQ